MDLGFTKPINLRKLTKSCLFTLLAHLPDICFCSFMVGVRFTSSNAVRPSAFTIHVMHVVELSSKLKVRWINASRTISVGAIVQNEQAVRDRSEMQNVTGSVCEFHPMLVAMTAPSNLPVPIRSTGWCPKPARFGNPHLGKESCGESWTQPLLSQVFRCYMTPDGICFIHTMLSCASERLQAVAEAFRLSWVSLKARLRLKPYSGASIF
jgi:hypothetical protein